MPSATNKNKTDKWQISLNNKELFCQAKSSRGSVVQNAVLSAAGHEVAAGTSSRHVQTQHWPEDDRQSISPGVPYEQILLLPVNLFVDVIGHMSTSRTVMGKGMGLFWFIETKRTLLITSQGSHLVILMPWALRFQLIQDAFWEIQTFRPLHPLSHVWEVWTPKENWISISEGMEAVE